MTASLPVGNEDGWNGSTEWEHLHEEEHASPGIGCLCAYRSMWTTWRSGQPTCSESKPLQPPWPSEASPIPAHQGHVSPNEDWIIKQNGGCQQQDVPDGGSQGDVRGGNVCDLRRWECRLEEETCNLNILILSVAERGSGDKDTVDALG
ncbi:unnamed protein product [Boreogadus saida]